MFQIDEVEKVFSLLCQINCQKYCSAIELAKELKCSKSQFMEFILQNKDHFKTKIIAKTKKTDLLVITDIYLNISDNPSTKEYLDKKIVEYKNHLELSYYDNYGRVEGVDIEPSKSELASQFLNTKEKIEKIRTQFNLKEASYFLGGFGDYSTIKPDNGYEVNEEVVKNSLRKAGPL